MARYGAMHGPDTTFLGVPGCDLDDAASWADAAAVVVGAPYDGGASYRGGARFGPSAMRADAAGGAPWDPAQPLLEGR